MFSVTLVIYLAFEIDWPGGLSESLVAEAVDFYRSRGIRKVRDLVESVSLELASNELLRELGENKALLREWGQRAINNLHVAHDEVLGLVRSANGNDSD